MPFRCLFIIRIYDVDANDLQSYCYKPFDNVNKLYSNENLDSIPLKNISEWYQFVIAAISDSNYMNFDESSIKDYICNPIYQVKTDCDILQPCVLIKKNNFIFGGLLFHSLIQKSKIKFDYEFGSSVDFICGMTSYFLNIIKKNPKIKIVDMIIDFYHFIKIMCPYGTPITSNTNLLDFFKNPEAVLKSLSISSPEKTNVSINQLPINIASKTKEFKLTIKEIVTGVQHESKNGQAKYDIDIFGEVILSTSNLDLNSEISFTLKPNTSQKIFSKAILTDLLLHPSCISCNYQTPISLSMENRIPSSDLMDKTSDDSPNSPNFLVNENPLVQSVSKKYGSIDSSILNYRLQGLSRTNSISTKNVDNILASSVNIKVKPWPDSYTLLSYKLMQYLNEKDLENISIPFITSCKSPEPPIFCSYQLEDMTTTNEIVSNIIFRIKLNPNIFPMGDKIKAVEFSKFEVIFPFPNRPSLFDTNKCTVSQGRVIILEQNRHIMVWTLGSTLRKNEATLNGTIKFQTDINQTPFVDKFCVQSNAYVQVNFALKSNNLSGLSMDTRNFSFPLDNGVKIIQKQECVSFNLKVWNSLGLCPIELSN